MACKGPLGRCQSMEKCRRPPGDLILHSRARSLSYIASARNKPNSTHRTAHKYLAPR